MIAALKRICSLPWSFLPFPSMTEPCRAQSGSIQLLITAFTRRSQACTFLSAQQPLRSQIMPTACRHSWSQYITARQAAAEFREATYRLEHRLSSQVAIRQGLGEVLMRRHEAAHVLLGLVGGLLLQGLPSVCVDGHRQAWRQYAWALSTMLCLGPGLGYAQRRAQLGRPCQLF